MKDALVIWGVYTPENWRGVYVHLGPRVYVHLKLKGLFPLIRSVLLEKRCSIEQEPGVKELPGD